MKGEYKPAFHVVRNFSIDTRISKERERGSFSRGETWKLIISSAAFRQTERAKHTSNRQVNRRLLLVHVKRFVPQNIEFVVYHPLPPFHGVLIFVYRLSTGRYISENLPISGRPGISGIPFTIGRAAADVFQIKVSLIPADSGSGITHRMDLPAAVLVYRRIDIEKIGSRLATDIDALLQRAFQFFTIVIIYTLIPTSIINW